ncbi:MAG: hypothetical protein SVO01_08555 [Thermotogota bacterium]|nr:hypothetical protein [Thermotogota bacterium]
MAYSTKYPVGPKEKNLPDTATFDLNQLSVQQFIGDLKRHMDQGRPRTALFKWWGNKKAKLDAEQQQWVLTQLQQARAVATEMNQLKVELFLTPEVIQNLIENHRLSARQEMEFLIKNHAAVMHGLDKDMELKELEVEKAQAEIDIMKLKAQAETALLNAQTAEIKAKVGFMLKVMDSIDVRELPPFLQSFVIASIFSPNQQYSHELQLMEDLKQYSVEKAQAEANILGAQARKENIQADLEQLTRDRNYERNKRKPPV